MLDLKIKPKFALKHTIPPKFLELSDFPIGSIILIKLSDF